MALRHRLKRHRLDGGIASALLLTLLLRAVVPLGYMPGDLLTGQLAALCPIGSAESWQLLNSLDHALDQSLDHSGHHHGHVEHDSRAASGDEQCPIGEALGAAFLLPSLDAHAVDADRQKTLDRRQDAIPEARRRRSHPARAPPAA